MGLECDLGGNIYIASLNLLYRVKAVFARSVERTSRTSLLLACGLMVYHLIKRERKAGGY
jgi:hypothetical protein